VEPFIPGQEYNAPFEWIIFVCDNPQARSFDRCHSELGGEVLNELKQKIMALGLVRKVMVASSSCLMGCKPQGVTVLLVNLLSKQPSTRFFNNVTPDDLELLLEQVKN
jgi:predicted metal-binding protein